MFLRFLQLSPHRLFALIGTIALGLTIFSLNPEAQAQQNQVIRGTTQGKNNSGDCGFIADKPDYVLNLSEQTYSLNVVLDAKQGKPSLLILGPGSGDRFCVLGAPGTGKKAKMGGVWAPGRYLIYVGDARGNRNPFTLRIIRK